MLRERETEAEVEGSAEGLREVELEGPAEKVPPDELLPLLAYVIVSNGIQDSRSSNLVLWSLPYWLMLAEMYARWRW